MFLGRKIPTGVLIKSEENSNYKSNSDTIERSQVNKSETKRKNLQWFFSISVSENSNKFFENIDNGVESKIDYYAQNELIISQTDILNNHCGQMLLSVTI